MSYEHIMTTKEKRFYKFHKIFSKWTLTTIILMGIASVISLIAATFNLHWIIGYVGMMGLVGLCPSLAILLSTVFAYTWRKIDIDASLRRRQWKMEWEDLDRSIDGIVRDTDIRLRIRREPLKANKVTNKQHFDDDLFTI